MASVPPATRTGLENLGRDLRLLVTNAPAATYEGDYQLGLAVETLLGATLKAVLPGRQKGKQITEQAQAGRKAFARQLARKVKPYRPEPVS